MPASPLRIAHRGMPRLMHENTRPSFSAALAAGADGIELDVHATADGVVIVHHDPVVLGMEIRRTRWSDLESLDLASGAGIPTLEEVCRLVSGSAELFIEIKAAGIEGLVVDVLAAHDGPAAIHSFDHVMIGRLAARGVPYRLGLLFDDDVSRAVTAMRGLGALDVWPHHSLTTERLIDEVQAAGGRVIPWTVNELGRARELASWGVDGLCSDDVSLLNGI
jgi:glycerophosphoryl diester phosphodiesterase